MVVLILSFVSFAFYSPPIHLGAFSSCFLITSFISLSVTLLVCNAAFKLNHWDSSQKWYSSYQLTTKTVNKTSTGSAPLTLCCSFNSLQISVKTKWLNSKKKKKKKKKKITWRRIEILIEIKPFIQKKFCSIYREVLCVTCIILQK